MSGEKGVRKLSNAPLVFVLAQVKYSPILSMEQFIPAIQERVRKSFPKFRKGIIQALTIGPTDQAPVFNQVTRWEFANKGSDTGFILQPDSFVFQTTNYQGFDDFINNIQFALDQINLSADISLVERIGLRYIDAIDPKEGETLGDYIVPGLSGFPIEPLNAKLLVSHTETVAQSALGTLLLKATTKTNGQVLPPDISPIGLILQKTVSTETPSAIFDFDHFCERSMEFSVNEVIKKITELHDITSQAFWGTVTPHAVEQWA